MTFEETLITKLRRLPENDRARLMDQIDVWLQETLSKNRDIRRARMAVEQTWATIQLTPTTLRWIAESKDLEYDVF